MRRSIFAASLCLLGLLVGSMAVARGFNVLIVLGDSNGQTEAAVIEPFGQIGGNTFSFAQLNIATGGTRPIAGGVIFADEVAAGNVKLSDYDMIWLTWNGPGHDGDYFMAGVEEDLLKFVESGGIMFMSAFDDNFRDANGNQIGGWMPIDQHPAAISNTGDSNLTITPAGEATGIFAGVDTNALVLDDNFADTDPAYTVLATRDDNNQVAAFQLDYGLGAYLGVCVDARSTFPAAEPMVGNLLGYMATLRAEASTSVEPASKLPVTWGNVKIEY